MEIVGRIFSWPHDPYPLNGKSTLQNITLDPFSAHSSHLQHITGHGTADGMYVEGNLKHPET